LQKLLSSPNRKSNDMANGTFDCASEMTNVDRSKLLDLGAAVQPDSKTALGGLT
jgi:hypothetical protein